MQYGGRRTPSCSLSLCLLLVNLAFLAFTTHQQPTTNHQHHHFPLQHHHRPLQPQHHYLLLRHHFPISPQLLRRSRVVCIPLIRLESPTHPREPQSNKSSSRSTTAQPNHQSIPARHLGRSVFASWLETGRDGQTDGESENHTARSPSHHEALVSAPAHEMAWTTQS
ncbi:hypothetical protein BJ875DRAFT_81176 [Amylocarpus encephaloides]|uniref:Secreted protein n=1 Tax=Amylocarpus encephaloides TaxID=45428 RepID=A0A9P7YEH6_9HELO|nr:hypothetical protein BJ875DRAFT_81176 [Amylocarpus encephaloides]